MPDQDLFEKSFGVVVELENSCVPIFSYEFFRIAYSSSPSFFSICITCVYGVCRPSPDPKFTEIDDRPEFPWIPRSRRWFRVHCETVN